MATLRAMGVANVSIAILVAALTVGAMPIKEEGAGGGGSSSSSGSSRGLEERKQIMRGLLGIMYSFEIVVGGIVVCILGVNGACCLCPRKDRERLLAVLAAQRKATGAAPPRGAKGMMGGLALVLCLAVAVASQEVQGEGEGGRADRPSRLSNLEAQKALLSGMYGTIWSVKIIFGGIIICVLGIHGACCLCPQSEQARILAAQTQVRKAAKAVAARESREMAGAAAAAEEGKEL